MTTKKSAKPAPSTRALVAKLADDVVEGFQRVAPLLADLNRRVSALEAPSPPSSRKGSDGEVRAALVASIARDVAALVEEGRDREIDAVMEATGYLDNATHRTTEKVAEAIVALAAVIEPTWLEGTAHVAAFHRHLRCMSDWERANQLADEALRAAGVDVEARNARFAAEEARIDASLAADAAGERGAA